MNDVLFLALVGLLLKGAVLIVLVFALQTFAGKFSAAQWSRLWSIVFLGLFFLFVGTIASPMTQFGVVGRFALGMEERPSTERSVNLTDSMEKSVLKDSGDVATAPLPRILEEPAEQMESMSAASATAEPLASSPVGSADRSSTRVDPGLRELFLIAWLTGVILTFAVLILYRFWGSLLLHSTARDAPESMRLEWENTFREAGFRGNARVFQSERLPLPAVGGLLRPTLYLPSGFEKQSPEIRRSVLAHEVQHLLRNDLRWRFLGECVAACHWPNPLVWIALRNWHRMQEYACDDAACRLVLSRTDYARCLFELVVSARSRSWSGTTASR